MSPETEREVPTSIRPEELVDRMAIRDLVAECCHRADNRDIAGQLDLFTPDARLAVYYGFGNQLEPVASFAGRADIALALDQSGKYDNTMHILGHTTIRFDRANTATAVSRCVAHLHSRIDGRRWVRTSYNRYVDQMHRPEGRWLIHDRAIYLDWAEERPCDTDSQMP